MPIHIYNSLTKKKEEFVPLDPAGKIVRMYSCGVTVYDQCHIGHARSLYIFDVIKRYLKYREYDVHFVRNITDIDDKIINKANETGKTSEQVAKENIDAYYKDLADMGINRADKEPRATENIPDMIKDIEKLIRRECAYEANGSVYYNVKNFDDYGKLSGQSVEKMVEAVRIEKDDKKRDPLDFALWKKSKEGEPAWDSPWGKGRPGWHIECSCMSLKHLGCQTLDIHAGGRDLIFPHHENEIAQAEPITKKPFAKYWIHHGLLTINGQKMAKSAGNFVTIQDALKKYDADDLKLFFLSSNYGSAIDFTEEKIAEAHKALDRFDILFWKAANLLEKKDLSEAKTQASFVHKHKTEFFAAMDDDFNTPKALAALFDLLNDTNKYIESSKEDKFYLANIYLAVNTIEDLTKNILGLFAKSGKSDISPEDQHLLDERKAARANKDFKRSDELRDALRQHGIIVEDSKEGQVWRLA